MGPFSNNPNTPSAPSNNGNKLPVPDVEGIPEPVYVPPESDNKGSTKKWLITTLIIAGVMAAAGVITFAIYVYVSNTPGYMLSAAMQNLLMSEGEAGVLKYESKQNTDNKTIQGDFLAFTDPTDAHTMSLTGSLGQDASRVSGNLRLFTDANYVQVAGLGNIGRLITTFGGNSAALTQDNLVRLSSLDGQWYSLTSDDVVELHDTFPQHTLKNGVTSTDVETLERLYIKHPFLKSAQQLKDERIENINTMHIKVVIDSAKLDEFLQAVKAANIKSLQLTDADIQAVKSNKFLDNAAIEAWIARGDRTFQQLQLTRAANDHTTQSWTITFRSELAAAQRQTVLRPDNPKSASVLLRSIHDIVTGTSSSQSTPQ
jgi:hypothetical protein